MPNESKHTRPKCAPPLQNEYRGNASCILLLIMRPIKEAICKSNLYFYASEEELKQIYCMRNFM